MGQRLWRLLAPSVPSDRNLFKQVIGSDNLAKQPVQKLPKFEHVSVKCIGREHVSAGLNKRPKSGI